MSQEIISDFKNKVEWLHEVEYGDFKRKLSLYIHRLEQSMSSVENTKVHQIIANLKHEIIYDNKPDIELSRMKTMDAIKKLETLL